ncbi:hypothetical protein [Natrinema halophilum]|uniref:hypothetical protein n=1 Tax=Natrinema halophilum TaxID=1699371 RepID=UPI001F35E80E|nr:hypothetical protein [Natrinema halophilum]UHQ96475.1 hypothetical protein HYG82_23420 [Natrinema halophilum]
MGIVKNIKSALFQQPTIDLQSFLINKGRGFTVSNRHTAGLGNGESIYLFVNNPAGSGYDYDIVLLPRASGRAEIDVSFNADAGDTGEAVTAHNLQSGSPRTFSGSVERSTTGDTGTLPSHGTTFLEDFVPGSGMGTNVAAQIVDSIAFTVDEGENKLLELRNASGGNVDWIGMNVVIFEVDGTYKQHR